MIFNISVTLYFGAALNSAQDIFYLKKFLLACGIKCFLAILRCEMCVLEVKSYLETMARIMSPAFSA
jgi:xanthine/uracil permease